MDEQPAQEQPSAQLQSDAERRKPRYICDRCGSEMVEHSCKVICPNCGSRYDCSDLSIYFD